MCLVHVIEVARPGPPHFYYGSCLPRVGIALPMMSFESLSMCLRPAPKRSSTTRSIRPLSGSSTRVDVNSDLTRRGNCGSVAGMSTKTAEAVWNGSLMKGSGHLKTQSGKLDTDYAWASRAEDGPGTNPEELIGAAHAGCFSMALAHALADAGHAPEQLHTVAKVDFDQVAHGFAITKIQLVLDAKVPDLSEAEFKQFAEDAKANCPVSKALAGVHIELDAKLT